MQTQKRIEAIYPLSHIQSGILFHALLEPSSSVYFEQLHCVFEGDFEAPRFKAAWSQATARHSALRTFFVWEKQKNPLQVVRRELDLPWIEQDWRDLSEPEQKARLQAFLLADRNRPFELDKAPLMRLALLRLAQDRWVFIWSHHHILLDGWSMTCIFRDVFAFYRAAQTGEPPQTAPTRPYRDYINWLGRQDPAPAETFWRKTLRGFSAPTPLPIMKAGAEPGAYRKQRLTLTEAASEALTRYARANRLTPNTLIHAAWSLLLARYADATDVVFGSTVSGRPPALKHAETMVGLFINTLPVRARVDGDQPLASWLQTLQGHLADRDEYHYAPLVDIHGWSDMPQGTPLFDSLLVFHNQPVEQTLENQNPKVTELHLYEQTNYSLMMEAMPGSRLTLSLSCVDSRFHEADIERMLNHFHRLLTGIAAGEAERLADLPMLSQAERARQTRDWNRTDRPRPETRFQNLFEAQAARTPDRLAASFEDAAWRYTELNGRANALAAALARRGAGPETVTALFGERNLDFLAALLAVLKTGGAFLPLDIDNPPQRLTKVLEIAAPRAVLVADTLCERWTETAALLPEDRRPAALPLAAEGSLSENPPCRADADHLAYVIFTSGTTGTPKGVMIRQAGMVNHLLAKIEDLNLGEADAVVQNAPQSFDIAIWQFLAAPMVGGRVHVVDRDTARDPGLLIDTANDAGATVLELVPAMLRVVLEEIERRETPPVFADLRVLMLTGEALPPELCRRWLARYPSIPIVNAYGPTECSDDITHHWVAEPPAESALLTPIGKAVANTQLYVLDRRLEPLPRGCYGECYAGGTGVGRGYLGEPALTAASFVPDPFSKTAGARLYKTGDLTRYCSEGEGPAGALEFHGRLDHQVKIRGFRIETAEIERVIAGSEAVADALVMARQADNGAPQLVAYLTPAAPPADDADLQDAVPLEPLRARLQALLPDYMMPAAFAILPRFPLTPNGKIDRKALPEPDFATGRQGYTPPRTRNERIMVEIWADALELARVGVYDNFFELGGHSIVATRVIARIRIAFQVEMPLRDMFAHPTPAELTQRVGALRRGAEAPPEKPIAPADRAGRLPLSFIQQQLWFLAQLAPDNPAYNVTRPARIRGPLNPDAIKAAVYGLAERHEILRTTFHEEGGVPYQRILDKPAFTIPTEDFSHVPEPERDHAGWAVAAEEAQKAFDLTRGPLFYARLLRFSDDDHVLLINLHHIVSDLWSREIMIRDGGEFYRAHLEGRPPSLPELSIQFADFAVWQRGREAVLEEQLRYWGEKLADAPTLELPLDRPRPKEFRPAGQSIYFDLPKDLVDHCRTLSQKENVTFFMFMMAAFNALLARYSGQDDIVVGTPVANRGYREVEDLIGFFLNTLVIRSDLGGDPAFVQLLGRVRQTVLESHDYQEAPFDMVVGRVNPERDISRNPLFQALFIYEAEPYRDFELPGLNFSLIPTESPANKVDFTLLLNERKDGQGLTGLMEFNTDLFDVVMFERMHRQFHALLASIVANPRARLSQLDCVPEAERSLLLDAWNRTEAEYPERLSIQRMIELQAARAPEALAIVSEGRTMTYDALDREANRLAWRLRQQGAGPEVLTAVLLPRSVELAVALLAILKTGGAYTPLDLDSPPERLAFILEDAGIGLALTTPEAAARLPTLASLRKLHVALDENADQAVPELSDPGSPDHAAYAIYTSGSTGAPKGVLVPRRALVNFCFAMDALLAPPRDVQKTWLTVTNPTFDISVLELLWTLAHGFKIVLSEATGTRLADGEAGLAALLRAHPVTHLQCTPSMARILLEQPALRPTLAGLETWLLGGEALPLPLVRRLRQHSSARLINVYGPTETTIWSTAHVLDEPEHSVSIGKPLANTQTYIVDRHLRLLPIGARGELAIGGDGVARGYLNRPALTAERFTPDPFGNRAGARLYRTGDLARFLTDGKLAFEGRVDFQVKLRGFRIELGEIETALAEHEAVGEAAVLAPEAAPGDKRLTAYLTTASGAADKTALETTLRRFLETKLPRFMMPGVFVFLDAMPLTAAGKLNRRALPAPVFDRDEDVQTAPRNETEALLAIIWEDVLQQRPIGVKRDFFALGGHSLLATQVVSRVRDRFGVELAAHELFHAPTVARLAAAIDAKRAEGGAETPIQPADRDAPLPLSFAQQRLWFLDQLEPNSPFYNMPMMLRLTGPLSPNFMQRALNALVRRHESLRTVFGSVDRQPVQIVRPHIATPLTVVDLAADEPARRQAETARLAETELNRPFDLSRGPLLRAVLLRLGPGQHILLFTIHHIVSDGWSMQVMYRELAAVYAAEARGETAALPPLPIQYPDFAVWQRQWLQGEVLARQLAYWKNRLAPPLPALELPTDFQRPAVERFRGRTVPFSLSPELTAALHQLAREREATLFIALLAAFQLFLSRYSGQRDIVVGAPIANRRRTELEGLIGFFANTLALRGDLSGNPRFTELLAQSAESTLGAYAHQDLPFEHLVEALKVKRDMSRSPVFQSMLALQNAPERAVKSGGLAAEILNPRTAFAKFDLTLFAQEGDGRLEFSLEYNTDLFAPATAKRMAAHIQVLLEDIVARPEARLSELALMTPWERRLVLRDWNRTEVDFAHDQTFAALIQAVAERHPERPALVAGDETLNYVELNRRANRLAHRLRAAGVGPNRAVGVLLDRSPAMMVSFLAVLKAGGAVVALDPAHPAARLEFVIRDAGLPALIAQDRYRKLAPADIAILDPEDANLIAEPDHAPPCGATIDHLLYIIYTSGSTGLPKGVGVAQRAILNLLAWQERFTELTGPARTLQFAAFGFCVSFQEILSTWTAGGALYLAGEDERRDPERLIAFLERHAIQRLHLPFAALKQLVIAAEETDKTPSALTDIITAGEPLQVNAPLRRLFQAMPHCRLHNQYGASETHVIAALTLSEDPASWPALPTAGHRVANTRIFVLDARLRPTPIGVPGVVYAAGPCLGFGYLGRPDWTAEKFVPDPFGEASGERLYCTGDMGRSLEDGALQVLGRADGMVKVQGYRVEPGEVETALRDHPSLKDAAVVPRPDGFGGWKLVAYAVPVGDAADVRALRDHLKSRLPAHAVPSQLATLDALPVTANGKLDRDALPEPTPDAGRRGTERTPPRTWAERTVAAIWTEVLGIESLDVHDDFFDLGGHSMLAAQVASRLREAFSADMELRMLFEHTTLAELSARLEAHDGARRDSQTTPIEPVPRAGNLPLSFAQERLWFIHRLAPESDNYNIPICLRLLGRFDAAALESGLTSLVARHEPMRTVFKDRDGRPRQRIQPAGPVSIPVIDLQNLEDATRDAIAKRLIAADAAAPYNLETGPLYRVALIRLEDQRCLLIFNTHHIISDGWSMGVLVRELTAVYRAHLFQKPANLPELPTQYADFAAWQRRRWEDGVFDAQLAYWRDRLAGAPASLDLPADFPRPPIQRYEGGVVPIALSPQSAENMERLAKESGATPFMVLLAAYAAFLSRYSGQDDLTIGSPIANRNRRAAENLIGFFVNMLALRVDLSGDPSFADLLAAVRRNTLEAYDHQDVSFEQIVEAIQPERDMSRHPLFQAGLALQNTPRGALRLPGASLETVDSETATAKWDLDLSLARTEEGFLGGLTYSANLFRHETAQRMAVHFQKLLHGALDRPEQPLSRVSLMAESDIRLLARWNQMTADFSAEPPIHRAFEQRAARQPAAVALVCEDIRLSFAELNARANRLAYALIARGVGPETPVALCLERAPILIVALLATLKAGGAYIPLDPEHPAERLHALLDGVPLALVQEKWAAKLAGSSTETLAVDEFADDAEADCNPNVPLHSENAAYVIYTSGSTGAPKGVRVPHRALANFAFAMDRVLRPQDLERRTWLAVTNPTFDISALELLWTLARGFKTLLASEVGAAFAEADSRLAALLRDHPVSHLQCTPSMAQILAEQRCLKPALANLDVWLLGGEALPAPLVRRLRELIPARVINMYGPTETTIWSTFHPVDEAAPSVPIGKPLANTQVHVVDRGLHPLPVGMRGELAIGGDGVTRDYWNRPDLTAARFVPDPFADRPGRRLYRTGDLARFLPNGDLAFLGRIDFQVKLRGFRIEPAEIEAALAAHERVREAAVVALANSRGDVQLAAYVVPADNTADEQALIAGLRADLRRKLPLYLVPGTFTVLNALPLSPAGKLDRRALPEPAAARPAFQPPRTETERMLADIWSDALGTDRIGVHDSFFQLGGHSLLATQVVSRVQERFQTRLPLARLMESPTLADLAETIENLRWAGAGKPEAAEHEDLEDVTL